MAWNQDLSTASFRGIEFECVSAEDTLDRRIVEHEFPYRDGAELEDLGRRARPINLQAIFLGPDALARLGPFLQVADEGATGTLVHPLLGEFRAKVVSQRVSHDHSQRDLSTVDLVFKEDGTNTLQPDLFSIEPEKKVMETRVAEAQVALDAISESLPTAQTAIDNASSFIEDIESEPDDLTNRFNELAQNVADGEEDAARTIDEVNHTFIMSMRLALLSARLIRDRAEAIEPQVYVRVVPVEAPLALVALSLYGDASRANDLQQINRTRNPFRARPGALKVYGAEPKTGR